MNIAVVGTGGFGRLRGAAFARRGHVVAFVSRDLERARAATAAVGGPLERAASRLEDLVAWTDGVFVATPPACHSEAVLTAARAGKAVLVEKPVEATIERARSLRDALGDAARLVTVAENYRYLPVLSGLEPHLPRIGPLERIDVVHRRGRAPRGWRVDATLAGGGVLADMGVHYVHVLRLLLGDLVLEEARETAIAPGVDGAFFLAGSSAKGARWSIDLSWVAWRRRSVVTLAGPRGSLRFRVSKRPIWRRTSWGLPVARHLASREDEYGQETLHDRWLASRGGTPPIPLDEGIRDLAIVSDAYALARSVRPR